MVLRFARIPKGLRASAFATLAFIGLSCAPTGAPSRVEAPPAAAASDASIVREELDRAVAEWAPSAAVAVVVDARTGRVLVTAGREGGRDAPTLAVTGAWITGSTLKTLTFAAALDEETITPETRVDCASRRYGDALLTDGSPNGVLSVRDALAVSSNVGASRVYDTLGLERLRAAYLRMHLFDAPGVLPAVSDPHGIEAAALAAGEGAPAAPVRVAAAYAAIFAGGVYHAPTFDGPLAPGERVLKETTARTVRELLVHVVEGGVGLAKTARVPGHRVAGKTGTADLGGDRFYASFVGAVVDREPLRVVLVGLVDPKNRGNGPTAAAPLFARIAARLAR